MNRNLSKLQQWSLANRLTINASKTKYLLLRKSERSENRDLTLFIGPTRLTSCTNYDYLGFKLDVTMSFRDHINKTISNCNARLVTLSKIRKYIDKQTAVHIYKSFIMAKLYYGLVFALNSLHSDRKRLQTLQNRALRINALAGRYVTNLTLRTECKVLPIALRAKLALFDLMFQKTQNLGLTAGSGADSPLGTRLHSAPTLPISFPRYQHFRNLVTFLGPTAWKLLTPYSRNILMS